MNTDNISEVIPYLATKFNHNLFRRMQINLDISDDWDKFDIP